MKLVGKHIEKDRSGYVTLRPEEDEDMWHLYNLIQEGDEVRAPAIRRVQTETSTGSTSSHRVKTTLTLSVEKMHFSAAVSSSNPSNTADGAPNGASSSQGASLSISGQVTAENQFVKMGAYHTLDLEVNRDVRIIKVEWDSIALQRVREACEEGRGAEVGAIVCGEGTAAVCLLSEHMTVIRQRVEVPVPRKRIGSTTLHDKGLQRFYETVYQSFLRHIPYASLRAIVIASPGFVRDAIYDYIFGQATKANNKALLQAKNKFMRVHVNSPHVHSLMEVMKSPEVTSQLKETKFAREGIMLDKFHKMLGVDEMRAWYGPEHVALAADRGAIGTLLISDELFRAKDPSERKKYVRLVESVRQKGAEVLIFSSMHESGQQLNQLTGIAAILTFPLDVEVVEAEERAVKEEESRKLEQLKDKETT
ncbi:mRNA surveillance pelota [Pyrrhoderma noxium]|uniref:Protein DOM34 homolog n=1 Tax=Pyrrhoderma noxium TaxID=2282107 RepID=A0A286UMY6_9AGAM|nr:mRNA surveillance pelota [Pyrrhoderma noxium]